ncbi:hypothetical protein BH18ACI3_BH18ACI3_05280 [soil metagenome]
MRPQMFTPSILTIDLFDALSWGAMSVAEL